MFKPPCDRADQLCSIQDFDRIRCGTSSSSSSKRHQRTVSVVGCSGSPFASLSSRDAPHTDTWLGRVTNPPASQDDFALRSLSEDVFLEPAAVSLTQSAFNQVSIAYNATKEEKVDALKQTMTAREAKYKVEQD
jgi:hypothetical protein